MEPTVKIPPGARVLLVDDEPHMLGYLRRLFEREGHPVACAADASAALERLASGGFDLVVTDKNLPGLRDPFAGGFEVLEAARDAAPPVPAVMISGFAGEADVRRATELGARAVLRKPFTREEILSAASRALSPRGGPDGEPGAEPPGSLAPVPEGA